MPNPASALRVCHVMRTYGNHGGERQLAQMFAQKAPEAEERFAFLYRDDACETLFSKDSTLHFHRLWPLALRPRYSAWSEMLWLLPILPWLQLRLFYLLVRHKCNACIVHGFQAALVAWPACILLGKKIGFAYFHRITKSSTGRHPLFKLIYAPYRKMLGVSLAVRDSMTGLADASRLDALENGVDVAHIQEAVAIGTRHTPPVIISVGRLLPHKGQELIIEAFAQCQKTFPHLELWIVGNGEYRDSLEKAAANLHGIHFLGRREDIPELLAQASVFCNASEWEGMSNAVLEAMAAGLPSVAVDAPGVTECHVNNVTGFIVPRNVEAITKKLLLLLKDAELSKCMGEAALQRVRDTYSIEANRKKYIQLYHQLAEKVPCAA